MLTHAEFFYDVWAEKIRSKPVLPYVRAPKGCLFYFFSFSARASSASAMIVL